MNTDIENIFQNYKRVITENVAAPAPVELSDGKHPILREVERMMAQGPAQDAEGLNMQVQQLANAQNQLNQAYGQAQQAAWANQDSLSNNIQSPDEMPADGLAGSMGEKEMGQINNAMTEISKMAQTLIPAAQAAGVNAEPLMESMRNLLAEDRLDADLTEWFKKIL